MHTMFCPIRNVAENTTSYTRLVQTSQRTQIHPVGSLVRCLEEKQAQRVQLEMSGQMPTMSLQTYLTTCAISQDYVRAGF